ncbi:MAG TPA: GFA family protein, partial [Myxococcota bacterium]|nr:GFA family protein [Myxococcota bacterium]
MVRGSCLCGDVAWEADGPFELMAHCHCTRCRKVHGTAFSTGFAASTGAFRFTRSAERIATSASPLGPTRPFCSRCGASV